MRAQRCALDEMRQRLGREFALDNHRGIVRFLHEFHEPVGFRAVDARRGKDAVGRKDEQVVGVLDLDAVADAVQIPDEFLEIGRGQIDDGGIGHVRYREFFRVGIEQPQLLAVALFDAAVVVLQTQVRHDTFVVVTFFNVHRQRVVVGHRRDDLEQLEGVGADHDFLWVAYVLFEFAGVERDVQHDGMCFVKIDDFHAGFGKGDGGVRQDVFHRRHHVADGLDLDRFDGQHVVLFVHCLNPLFRFPMVVARFYVVVFFQSKKTMLCCCCFLHKGFFDQLDVVIRVFAVAVFVFAVFVVVVNVVVVKMHAGIT